MSAPALASSTSAAPRTAVRIQSLDIFRGITLAVMIFVNALSGVHGLPWWTYHAHAEEDRMTYVDMVFPTFLFIVGVAMPIAIGSRLRKNSSQIALWGHILLRSFSLLVLGLILANAEFASRKLMPMGGAVWAMLALLACCLYLNVYPKSERFARYATALKIVGLAGAVILLAIFRRETPQGPAWLDFGYPEILGLIAVSYFAAALLYVPTRKIRWMQPVWLVVTLAFNAGCFMHLFDWADRTSLYEWPFSNGAMVEIIFAGIVTADLLFPPRDRPDQKPKIALTIGFGVLMLLAAYLMTPLGISKIRATPTWCLYSTGVAAILLAGLYWLCDVRQKTSWAWLFRPAGSNGLLTYLLPDYWEFFCGAFGCAWYESFARHGAPAVFKTIGFTIVILLLARLLTRLKLRLQL